MAIFPASSTVSYNTTGYLRRSTRAQVTGRPGGLASFLVPHATNYWVGSYSAYAFNFAAGGLTLGVDHDASWTVYPTIFPDASVLNWYVPEGTVGSGLGVWGYSALSFGNYDGNLPPVPVTPRQICNLTDFKATFNWSYSGSTYFGLLTEMWVTDRSRISGQGGNSFDRYTGNTTSGSAVISGMSGTSGLYVSQQVQGTGVPATARIKSIDSGTQITMTANATANGTGVSLAFPRHVLEIGFLIHAPDQVFHDSGTLIGTTHVNNGITYTARLHDTYLTFSPVGNGDVLTAGIDWKAALDFLVTNLVLTGAEWVNGVAFGVEPNFKAGSGTHTGQMVVNDLSYTFSGSTLGAAADYLGTNLFSATYQNTLDSAYWGGDGYTRVGGQTDIDGGTGAIWMQELATTANHGFFKNASGNIAITVDTAQHDYVWIEDIANNKGRDSVVLAPASSDFAHQAYAAFNLADFSTYAYNQIGVGLTPLDRKIVDLGGGFKRLYYRFRKAAGITSLFMACGPLNGGTDVYLGDITKGITVRPRHRLVQVA